MNRFKAFAVHLISSAIILVGFYTMASQVWYPGKLFSIAAGAQLIRLLICVDVIIGPLITFIIFNVKKKKLKQDLFFVVFCQLCFLVYGAWTIFTVRPAYIAFAEDQFFIVRANEIDPADEAKVKNNDFKSLPLLGPKFVGTVEPTDQKIKNDLVFSSLAGMGIQNLPQYFVPFETIRSQIKAAARTSKQLKKIDSDTRLRLELYERNHSSTPVAFIRLVNKNAILFVVINSSNGAVVDII
jgi:hypothetical protein